MNVNISCRDSITTTADKQFMKSLSSDLSTYFNDILIVEWDIKAERINRLVSCRLHSRSGYYRAVASSKDLRQAINLAYDKLIRQRRRNKSMRKTARRRIKK